MRTVWLLDVDGVINASRPGWGAPPRSATAYANGRPYRLRWEPQLLQRVAALNARGVVVTWATTWCDHAAELHRVFRIPPYPVAFGPRPAHLTFDEQKMQAAEAVLAAGDWLIWTDDDVVPYALTEPLFQEAVADGRALLIAPRPSRGLRPADLDAIEAFAGLREEILPTPLRTSGA